MHEKQPIYWPNPNFVKHIPGVKADPDRRDYVRSRVTEVANWVRKDLDSEYIQPEGEMKEGRFYPKPGSRIAKVLDYFLARPGEWIDGHEFCTPEVGGTSGLRRVRDLRAKGWAIEERPTPGSSSTWQYRLHNGGSPLINVE
jgi:hypothetical protein